MSAPVQRLLALTDIYGVAHLVTDESMATGHHSGRYLTLCAQRVLSASLTTPPQRHCPDCARHRGP